MVKINVAVLFGGVSSEYEVSLLSAASVIRNLPAERFERVLIGITKDGRWFRYFGTPDSIEDGSWVRHRDNIPAAILPDRASGCLALLPPGQPAKRVCIDVAFPVIHGRNGEDGRIQGLFELAGIPYVGCDVLSSAVCMDKAVANALLEKHGIRHAPWRALNRYERASFDDLVDSWEQELGYPMFVKPANAGSSVGVTKATNRPELRRAVDIAFEHDDKIVVERGIIGRELECSVLGNSRPTASVLGEVLPVKEFYDYEAKYLNGGSDTVIPAKIDPALQARIQRIAVDAFMLLGCKGMARVDFLLESATGEIYLNELNTIPGFTSISMYAKLCEASGIPYPELLSRLIDLALERMS